MNDTELFVTLQAQLRSSLLPKCLLLQNKEEETDTRIA